MPTQRHQTIWQTIRAQSGNFAARDIYGALPSTANCSRSAISAYLSGLARAGYLSTRGGTHNRTYQLARDVGQSAPAITREGAANKKGIVIAAIWRTMRILKHFSATELRVTASTDDTPVSETSVRTYIRPLVDAGILIKSKGQPTRYRLIPTRNTGPQPLIIKRRVQISDPNDGNRVIWLSNGASQ